MEALLDYSEKVTRSEIKKIPDGEYSVTDYMDDDGLTDEPVPITVTITITGDQITVDFKGTSEQRPGCINAPEAVTISAVLYTIRCIVGDQAPPNQGCLRPISIRTPKKLLVNPVPPGGSLLYTSPSQRD